MWVLDSQRPVFKSLLCHLQPVGLGEVYLEAQFLLLQREDKKKKSTKFVELLVEWGLIQYRALYAVST